MIGEFQSAHGEVLGIEFFGFSGFSLSFTTEKQLMKRNLLLLKRTCFCRHLSTGPEKGGQEGTLK